MRDRDVLLAGLDHRLERVGELGEDVQAERGPAREGAEPAGGVGRRRARELADDPAAGRLEEPLGRPEMRQAMRRAVADHHLRLAGENGLHEAHDIFPTVLVVRVRVDDDVGPELEGGIEAGLEGPREAAVHGKPQQVGRARHARDFRRSVLGAVVDDQRLDRVESHDGARQRGERLAEMPLLVEARNLDDELRHPAGGCHALARRVNVRREARLGRRTT